MAQARALLELLAATAGAALVGLGLALIYVSAVLALTALLLAFIAG